MKPTLRDPKDAALNAVDEMFDWALYREYHDAAETLGRILACDHDADRDVVDGLVFCIACRGWMGEEDADG